MRRLPFSTPIDVPLDDQLLPDLTNALRLRTPNMQLRLTWGEVIRGAVLCGVPGWEARRAHGLEGRHEIHRRAFHILSHLRVITDGTSNRVARTDIYDTEDGSEKTASSYLIGMALALAVSRATGHAQGLIHYDSVHGARGKRPDLVVAGASNTHFVEVKGRYRPVSQKAMDEAVEQLSLHGLAAQTFYAAAIGTGFATGRLRVHRQWFQASTHDALTVPATLTNPPTDLRSWEPLTLAIQGATREPTLGTVRTTEIDHRDFTFVELSPISLVVGLPTSTLIEVSRALRSEGVLDDIPTESSELERVSSAIVMGKHVDRDLLLGWGPQTNLEDPEMAGMDQPRDRS